MAKPLAIDMFTGLHGWAEGLVSAGFEVVAFDLEDMCAKFGMPRPEGVHLVLQDVLTLHGKQFADADLIVASPPCTEYSYMAMPWQRAKQIARALRGKDVFPEDYRGSRTIDELNALFNACVHIQAEACEAAGRHIPLVVENVNGAQSWIGRARWSFGSYYLWGDIPALMPIVLRGQRKTNVGSWDPQRVNFTPDHSWAFKSTGMNWSDRTKRGQDFTRVVGEQAIKGAGGSWFGEYGPGQGTRNTSSGSLKRKAMSALIAKIPFELASYIGRVYHPRAAA